jgi:hypothetical protein
MKSTVEHEIRTPGFCDYLWTRPGDANEAGSRIISSAPRTTIHASANGMETVPGSRNAGLLRSESSSSPGRLLFSRDALFLLHCCADTDDPFGRKIVQCIQGIGLVIGGDMAGKVNTLAFCSFMLGNGGINISSRRLRLN